MKIDSEDLARYISGPRVLRLEQVWALVSAPDCSTKQGRRDRGLLAVLVGGGLRVGEAVRLTVANVSQSASGRLRLTFPSAKARELRFRTVTLPEWAAAPLGEWLRSQAPTDWLFRGYRGRHLTVAGAERIVNYYLGVVGRSDLHTHSLRHTYGSMVTRETRSIFVAQKLLGHADPRTTARYYAGFEVGDADDAADALSAAVTSASITSAANGANLGDAHTH